MSPLNGFRVVQVGGGIAAAVCGWMLADIGANVVCIEPDNSTKTPGTPWSLRFRCPSCPRPC